MLLMMIQGFAGNSAGVRPKALITSAGLSSVITKITRFRAIRNQRTLRLTGR